MAVETNVNISMPDEHPSKCPKLQSEEIDRDPGTRKQICEFPINKQNEIRQAYLIEGPYQPENIVYPYNDDTHRLDFNLHGLFHIRIGWNTHLQRMRYIVYLATFLVGNQ